MTFALGLNIISFSTTRVLGASFSQLPKAIQRDASTTEKLTTKEVVRLLHLVRYNPISSVEDRIEEWKKMLIILESELEEQKNVLFHYNEKIGSARLILEGWKKGCKEVKEEFLRVYNEKERLQNLIHKFQHSDETYLKIQKIAEDTVRAFLAGFVFVFCTF